MSKKSNLKTLDQFIDEHYGKKGTSKRDKYDRGFELFKLGFILRQARLKKGLTRKELAARCGTSKHNISNIENDTRKVRISMLQKIVEKGLDGELQIKIKWKQPAK